MGIAPAAAVGSAAVFVTHGHTDHVAGLPSHASTRAMTKMSGPVVSAPPAVVGGLRAAMAAFGAMAESDHGATVEAVSPGDAVWLHGASPPTVDRGCGLDATAEAGSDGPVVAVPAGTPPGLAGVCVLPVPTGHRVPSQGYVVVKMKQQLLERFRGDGKTLIRGARAAGEAVTELRPTLVAAVTGDSLAAAVLGRRAFTEAPVLVTECTYADEGAGPAVARERGHTHAEELAEAWAARALRCRVLVLTHFSTRQSAAANARGVRAALEAALARRGAALAGWRLDGGGDVEWGPGVPRTDVAAAEPGAEHAPADAPDWPGRESDAVMAVLCADCDDDEEAGGRRPTVVCVVHHTTV